MFNGFPGQVISLASGHLFVVHWVGSVSIGESWDVTGTLCDALTRYSRAGSVNRCLAES